MNPLLVKLIVALAPSAEQVIAALLHHWLTKKKAKEPAKLARKVKEAAEAYGRAATDPNDVGDAENLKAWSKRKPTPNPVP